jgi:hypothetical protein
MNTAMAEENRIQYNFVKLHKALECQTPAQAAANDVNGKNK